MKKKYTKEELTYENFSNRCKFCKNQKARWCKLEKKYKNSNLTCSKIEINHNLAIIKFNKEKASDNDHNYLIETALDYKLIIKNTLKSEFLTDREIRNLKRSL